MGNRDRSKRAQALGLALAAATTLSFACTDDGSPDTAAAAGDGGHSAGSGGAGAGSGASGAGSSGGGDEAGSNAVADAGSSNGSGGDAGSSGGEMVDAGEPAPGAGDGSGPTFVADVHPLLVAGCGSCHGAQVVSGPPRPGGPGEGGANGPGKFGVDDAEAAYLAVQPYVVAGDPEHSALYIKISQDMPSTGGQRMPPALRQWDDASIQLVKDWIAAGAAQE